MKKAITFQTLSRGMIVFLLVLVSGIMLAQNVPEWMYFKFNVTGSQPNAASAPVGTNPAILDGLTTGGIGQFGTALIGNGLTSTTNRLNTGWATNLPSTGWTISFWLNNFPATSSTTFYYFGDVNAASFRCFTGGVAPAGGLLLRGTGFTDVPINSIPSTPTVIHLVYTGAAVKVFKNGILDNTVVEPALAFTGAGPFLVGGYSSSNSINAGVLMDEFRLYNRALPDAEVLATWNNSLPVGPTGGTLSGTVTNATTSAPLAGATIAVGALNATSAANGTYSIANVPAGVQTATCTATGFLTQNVSVTMVLSTTTTQNFAMVPSAPIKVSGTVTDASTGAPIVGAVVTVGTGATAVTTMTIAGGTYLTPSLTVSGPAPIVISKTGYDNFTGTVTLVPNVTVVQDASLLPTAVQPGPFTAALNNPTTPTAVNLNWGVPQGMYQLIYDDGTQDNFAIWANANNLNALKFTPLGWPIKLIGGKVNLGTAANYPSNVLPFTPFKMMAYKADGPGGVPGTIIDSVTVTPTDFGWADFSFSVPITINSGNFYLVMKQGGTPPHAAGIGVDLTNTQLRSYSKFVTGGGPWVPAAGNFMMRAIIQGVGGPMLGDNSSAEKQLITASAVNGLIYQTPVSTVTGYEGVARTEPFDWSTMQNTNVARQISLPAATWQPASETGVGANFVGTTLQTDAPASVLFDNGPLVNSVGTGTGGLDESVIQAPLNSYGWNMAKINYYRMADDFTVSGNPWNVSSVEFYGYQTNSPTTSTFTAAYLRILNGVPGAPGTTVVWGDTVTNVMSSTSFTNIYRTAAVNGGVARPIMKIVVNTSGLSLPAGTYYVDFCAAGSLTSGPWCPPVTLNNNPVTGNGLVYGGTAAGYQPLMGGASATYPQGIPFKINGTQTSSSNMSYQVWRLLQGQEGNQALWNSIWTGNVNTTVDNSWPTLPNGAYRWAVKAIYSPPGQRPSAPTFSNVIGKGWIANVNVCVSLTCAANAKAGTMVKLVNSAYPDTNYTKTTDTSGCVHFTGVWKGTYVLSVTRFTYPVYTQNVTIMGDASYNVVLLQDVTPPTNLVVDNASLHSTWSPPRAMIYQLNEDFASGSFATNQWVVSGGTNWAVSTGVGNPAPSAIFNYAPVVTNYDQYLTSKSMAGLHAPMMKLKYDIFLNNYATTNLNTIAVELWNGATWTTLKSYTNMGGSIPWTSETLDITSVTNNPAFKIRFHTSGVTSNDINNWNVDNIKIYSTDGTSGPNPCVIGYNYYLNNVLVAFTPDTMYNIPPNQVVYGQNYTACVKAVYGSGYSPQICVNFMSKFLYPARDLTATGIECNAYLSWKKPVTMGDSPHVPAFTGIVEHTTPDAGRAPYNPAAGNSTVQTESPLSPLGSTAFGCDAIASPYKIVSFDINNLNGMTQIANNPLPDFMSGFVYPMNETTWGYCMAYGQNILYKMTVATGAITTLGPLVGLSGGFAGITIDPTTGIYYGSMSSGTLYKFDPVALTATLIGSYGGVANLMIGITCDINGNMWGHDIGTDNFFSINKLTGAATVVGPLGFNANYAQSEFYDKATSKVLLGAYNLTTAATEIRAVDVTTGGSVILSSGVHEITAAGIPMTGGGGGGGTPAGLIGYNIYRGGAFIHYNPHPDSITYYDYGLNPGTYKYDVKAKYDLTSYGFPGQTGESLGNTAGEKTVTLNCGAPLPFYEPWDLGTFAFQSWAPTGHWTMNAGIGNPAPCADFAWQPAIANYSQALTSEIIDATAWTCAKIWLDFDYKLIDHNNTGKEKLTIDIFYGGAWHQKAELTNNGSTNWMPKHLDISNVKGKSFRMRFVANGVNSADILHWYVDNIHAYGICTPATALAKTQSHFTTTLTWTAPNCVGSVPTQLKKLFQWAGTPDNAYYQAYNSAYGVVYDLATYPDASLNKIDFHHASWGTTGTWQYKIHVVDWTSFAELGTLGPITTTGNDIWENNIPLGNIAGVGGKKIGIMLEPLSNSPTDAYPCFSADNVGPDGVSVFGPLPNYSAFAPSAIGDFLQNLWIEIPAGDKSELVQPRKVNVTELQNLPKTRIATSNKPFVGYLTTNQFSMTDNSTNADSSVVTGYNVYRTAATGVAPYNKLNASPLTATTYVDTYPSTLVSGTFKYYVTVLYKNSADNQILCEPSTDTVTVYFPAVGLNELTSGQIMIYPNPATEVVNIKSDYTITGVDVMNFVGQTVYTINQVDAKTARLNVTTFKTGVYFVKVTTTEGIRTVKITVTH